MAHEVHLRKAGRGGGMLVTLETQQGVPITLHFPKPFDKGTQIYFVDSSLFGPAPTWCKETNDMVQRLFSTFRAVYDFRISPVLPMTTDDTDEPVTLKFLDANNDICAYDLNRRLLAENSRIPNFKKS